MCNSLDVFTHGHSPWILDWTCYVWTPFCHVYTPYYNILQGSPRLCNWLSLRHLVPWINSLWPSDAIWCQRSWSTLVQVMACCLMAPSHYLNQCWLYITEVLWQSSEGNFTVSTKATTTLRNEFENLISKIIVRSSRANELAICLLC